MQPLHIHCVMHAIVISADDANAVVSTAIAGETAINGMHRQADIYIFRMNFGYYAVYNHLSQSVISGRLCALILGDVLVFSAVNIYTHIYIVIYIWESFSPIYIYIYISVFSFIKFSQLAHREGCKPKGPGIIRSCY